MTAEQERKAQEKRDRAIAKAQAKREKELDKVGPRPGFDGLLAWLNIGRSK
jgi:hypothetical protein